MALLVLFAQAAMAQCGVNAGAGGSICTAGQTITLTATATSGNPDTFTWTSNPASVLPSTKSITVSPNVTTTYYVQATGNACDAADSVVVKVGTPPPTPSFTYATGSQCTSIPITFSTTQQAGYGYSWSFGDGSTASGATASYAYKAYGTGTGTYTVTLTDTNAAGCTASVSENVSVIKGPAPLLGAGPGVDTLTFDGNMTFYVCAAAAQQNLDFAFINQAPTGANITYKILWGDTGVPYVSDTAWTLIKHTYGRSTYYLSYIVTNTTTGCSDTAVYKVFYGSNPSGGIASPGNTDICGPGVLTFVLSNFASNTPGTIYTITFNDSTPPIVFKNTPPDTITHLFNKSSCGVSSSNGVTTFPNSFAASLTVQNPCGITSGAVLPIYISLPPIANYTPPGTACTGTTNLYTNTTIGGLAASSSGCNNSTPILWNLSPSTGWTVTTGNMGSDNGFTGSSFDPALWTTGSNTLGISYTTPGTYTMRLVAANSCGPDTVIRKFCVAAPPSPTMSVSGLTGSNGCAPDTVTLTNTTFDTSTCSAPTYAWAVTKVSAVCTPDLANDYQYINHTDSLSDTTKIVFNNQGSYTVTLNASNVCGTYPATKTISIATPPQVSMSLPAAVCVGVPITPTSTSQACGGTVTGYAWSFPGGTPSSSTNQNPGSVSLGSTGNYTISLAVTNSCGTASASQNISVSSYPVANPGPNQQMCSGNSVTIGSAPVAGLTYSWLPVTGLSSASVSNPTLTLTNNGTTPVSYTYHLTVTNAANCSTTDSVVITVYPAAWVNAGPAIDVCTGQSVTLGGTFGGAATSVTWTSSGGGTFGNAHSATSIFTPPASGTVTLTLTTNTPTGPCPAATSTTTVTVVTTPVAVAGSDTSICSGGSIKIGGTAHAGYTYTWSPATGLSNIHSSKPLVTLTNTGNSPITQTYQLIVSATGCADTAQVTVTVYPAPGASAGPNLSVCSGGSVTLNGSISGSATSAVWSSTTGTFGNPNSLSTTFTPNITSGIATVTLTTAQAAGGCASAVVNASVTVNSIPTVTNTPLFQDICTGTSTQAVNLAASIGGSTFSWSGSSSNGATGFIASGTTSTIPAQTLSNSGTAAESVVYVITPSANGCTGPSANYTINIEPQPKISAIAPQTICSGSVTTAVTPVSSVTGSSFSWTATAGANLSGYYASGTGNIPAQTILNSGNKMDSVVYSVMATANSCGGPVTKFVVHVNPLPSVTVPAAQTICSGATTTAVNLTSNVNSATFSWTANASAGITGFTASGTGNIPAETLRNSSTTAGNVTYSISAGAAGCTGAAQAYTVTVNPVPTATATPASPSVCSGTNVNIALSANITGTTFSWTEQSAAGITGASNGSGNTIGQTLSNSGTATGKVTYYITATANSCGGPVDTEVVSVYPVVNVQFSTASQSICSGQSTQVVILTSSSAGASFSWTSQANGITGVPASGADSIPAQVLTNNTSNALTADYNITASFAGCTGQSGTYPVTVSPQPSVTLPAPQTICSGNSTSAVTITSGIPGTTFAWAVTSHSNVTGYIAGGTGANIPAQTLTDTSSAAGSITYSVTPSLGGCEGPAADYTITVNSSLTITPVSPQSMCSGSTGNGVTLSSNLQNTTFNWTATAGAFISGFTSQGTGNIPGQTISNSGNAPDSIVYTITANASGCTGSPARYVLTVNPIPQVITPAQQAICSGSQTSVVDLTSNVAGTTFSWMASASPYLSGYQTSGTGNIPVQTIYNSGYNDDSVVYGITPVYGNCEGQARYFAIVVHPGSNVVVNAASNSICSGMQTNITLSSSNAAATFTWMVNEPTGISGASSGSGNTIDQVLVSNGQTAQTVSYIIIPGGSGCPGLPDTFNVTVNPGIDVQLSSGPQTICSGQSTQAVSLSSNQSGVSFSWFAQSNGISGVTSSGTDVIPVQTLYNQSSEADSVNYVITATSGSCPGQTSNYRVLVNPQVQINLPAPQSICSGNGTSQVNFTSNVAGTSFTWTATADSVTGYIPGGTGASIPAQTLSNNFPATGTVNYTIVPSANGCAAAPVNYTINVNPAVVISPVSPQMMCSGSQSTYVKLNANVDNISFEWNATGGPYLEGYMAQGTGNIPAQTILNTGNTPDSVIYTISANAGGCPGNTERFTLTVNPLTQAIVPGNQLMCSGSQSTPVNLTATVNGTTFTWTASASSFMSGYASMGTGDIPSQTIFNSGSYEDSVNYTITPTAYGCAGPNKAYEIKVRPNAKSVSVPSGMTLCSGMQTLIALSSSIQGATFLWVVNEPAGVTGASSGYGDTISQTLYNSGSNPATVIYVISPEGVACPGKPDSIDVVVTPGINIQLSAGPQNICSGQNTQAVNLSSTSNGVSFSWVSQANGVTGAAAYGTNIIPVQTLVNSNLQTDSVSYMITATSAACPAQTAEYSVAVKPNPQINLPSPQAVCSGTEASAIHFSSTLGGSAYSWTGSASSGITGVIPSGSGDSIPAITATNSTFDTGTITYNIIATSNGCSSPNATYKVLVYPTPDVNVPANQDVCTGAQTAPVAFTSHVSGTVFNWAVSVDSNVTGNVVSGTGNIPAQTLDNATGAPGVLTYTVTPYAGNCKGVSANYTDTVYPTPTVTAPAPQTVCSGEWTSAITLTSPTPGASISWTAAIPAGISGATASGGNTISSQRLYNNEVDTFPQALTINYTLSASVQGSLCPAKNSTYAITVLPHPQASFVSSVSSGCSPLTVAFEPQAMNYGQPDSLIFMWGDNTPNTVVYPSLTYPEWYSLNHTFYNTSSNAVTYNVLMRASNGCWDTIVTRPITIMPNAVNAFFTTSPATGCAPLTVKFHDQSEGASILSWCFNYNIAKDSCMGLGVVDSAGSTISETFNAGTYTVALYAVSQYGCAHDTAYQTIVVNPSPVAAFTVPATTCAQNNLTFTNQSTPAPGSFIAQYSWQFGDGDSSLSEQASHTYASAGNYSVCLTVTSSSGCSNSVCEPVTVGTRPSVNFSVQNACVNQQAGYFTNLSTGAVQYYWLFGDGGASTAPAPDHVYLQAGTYTVTLVGSNTGGCSDTASHSLNIFPAPHAGFTTPPVAGCGLPAEMQLTNTSTGAIAYEWNLGNGVTSQFDNPDAIYTATGTFTITLVASNSNNCFDTATGQVTIYPKPVVIASIAGATGCQPLPVLFHANATNANTYVWNFGDGNSETTTVPFATHSYPDTGYYPVTLMVYSQGSCGDTITLPDSVIVHPIPTAGFQYYVSDSNQLNNGTIQFINTSANANIYNWYFGDGANSQEVNPLHMFPDVDQFEVMLIATNSYGCRDTALQSLDVVKKSLYVPNAFAPEYSGPNTLVQVWKPAGIGLRTYKAQVFDKWGELLWESSALTPELEPAEGWDGSYQGKLCQQGVYVWKIEATFVDGTIWTGTAVGKEKVAKTIGSVTLIR